MIIITLLISIVSSYQIWQVTDVHFDGNYKEGSDPNTVCRSGEGTARKIGDYSCDTTDYVLKSVPKFINYQTSDKKHNKILIKIISNILVILFFFIFFNGRIFL